MDLKLLLSPAQKDPEADSASAHQTSRDDNTTGDRPNWQYRVEEHPFEQQQQRHNDHGHPHDQPFEPYRHGQPHGQPYQDQPDSNYTQQEHMPQQPLVPPLLSVSASTPQPGESPQPPQYFVPTHRAPPQGLPPPSGLNLSSYSFLLMEKRDREREAMEKANRGYLLGEMSSNKNESASSSPRIPSPRIEPAQRADNPSQATAGASTSYSYHPPQGYEAGSQYHSSGSHNQQYTSYPGHGSVFSSPSHYGYQQHPPQQYSHYHSSSSTNIGQDPPFHQDYPPESHGPAPYPQHLMPHHRQHLHHRSMSPGQLGGPRFANSNLSVFRQSAAEDSDGNASVSSNGSLKRRRRPTKTIHGKKPQLPGSGLGVPTSAYGGFPMSRSSSHGSVDPHEDFYDDDDDSLDEHFDVRNGLQGLNLQKSVKSSGMSKRMIMGCGDLQGQQVLKERNWHSMNAWKPQLHTLFVVLDRTKKSRTKSERPFKIGEQVESMKSDTNGTWFAGRVVDLEDDPHDHINPKSVLVHFEGFSPHHDEWVKPSQLRACSTGSSFLRYGPNGHEPAENWIAYEKFYHSDLGRTARRHTGLAYDRRMLLHKCQCNTNPEERHHPEQPERLVEILCQFQKHGMLSLVKWIQGREATIEELVAAHANTHVRNYCCTAAQNRLYALEHGIDDADLQTEDDVEGEIEGPEEEEERNNGEPKEIVKEPGKRGRPRKTHRGSIHVATTSTSAADPNAVPTLLPDASIGGQLSEDVEMSQSTSPIDANKDGMEVDLHSPALGRRRSSMRGSALRMSSLVSMSSTLFAQKEEDVVPEDKEVTLAADDDDDDDDDKATQAGPAPSEAALAVAGGMDPALASQLSGSPPVNPKMEKGQGAASTVDSTLGLNRTEDEAKEVDTIAGTSQSTANITNDAGLEKPKIEHGMSVANIIGGERRSSRSLQGQSGATAVVTMPPPALPTEGSEAGGKSKDKKVADKTEKTQKDGSVIKAPIKKKGLQAMSPVPASADGMSIIRPPGLTFTMSCGQLGIAVDTTWNPHHSSTAAKVAAGCLINLVDQVVTGRCKNGFAIIRPPGHHAEEDEAMGFCFFNNVGVAVNLTLSRYPLTIQKILVIDWDVHHGNGTQQIFYENPNVLYISLHRWDNGHFYPFTGSPDECGEEAGEGTNVNIAWSSYGRGQAMGDVEYIAAFWYVLLPIARQFQPDLVFVSAGFDAADGHAANIGGYTVSPQGFAILTRLIQTLAGGRVILSLEGGYEFEPLALSATACLEELLPHSLLPATAPTRTFPFASFHGTLNSVKPNAMAVSSLHQVLKYQQKYWKFPPEVLNPSFRFHLPAEWKASNSLATRPRRERNTRRKGPALDS